jgi:hypothetical protein
LFANSPERKEEEAVDGEVTVAAVEEEGVADEVVAEEEVEVVAEVVAVVVGAVSDGKRGSHKLFPYIL